MPQETDIPRKSIYRLSIYQRCLERLRDNGVETVSSNSLAKAAGVKSAQLRKDLAHFGQFGTRGLGYSVDALIEVITGVLGTSSLLQVILVASLKSSLIGGIERRYARIVVSPQTNIKCRPIDNRIACLICCLVIIKYLSK